MWTLLSAPMSRLRQTDQQSVRGRCADLQLCPESQAYPAFSVQCTSMDSAVDGVQLDQRWTKNETA
jgi:hypothetical protein